MGKPGAPSVSDSSTKMTIEEIDALFADPKVEDTGKDKSTKKSQNGKGASETAESGKKEAPKGKQFKKSTPQGDLQSLYGTRDLGQSGGLELSGTKSLKTKGAGIPMGDSIGETLATSKARDYQPKFKSADKDLEAGRDKRLSLERNPDTVGKPQRDSKPPKPDLTYTAGRVASAETPKPASDDASTEGLLPPPGRVNTDLAAALFGGMGGSLALSDASWSGGSGGTGATTYGVEIYTGKVSEKGARLSDERVSRGVKERQGNLQGPRLAHTEPTREKYSTDPGTPLTMRPAGTTGTSDPNHGLNRAWNLVLDMDAKSRPTEE